MSNKRKMAEEEDEHGRDNLRKKPTRERNKSAKRKQKFKIYHTGFLTAANRDERKKTSVTLELNEDTSEREIRNSLVSEFSQLRDKNFKFFTKDKEGKCYYCPCKPKCNEDHFKAEWNASNITKMVKGDRPVHILIEDVSEADGPSSGYGTTDTIDNHRPSNPSEDELLGEASLMDYVTDQVSSEPPLEIKQIVPQEGKVEGGCTFFLELKERCVDEFKVQFGETDPIGVERINEMTYKGTVPASSHAGVVAVKIVKTLKNCKNTIAFTYIEEGLEKKSNIREILGSMDEDELTDLLIATVKQFSEMSLKSNKEKTRYGDSGGGKNHSLPLLRMIADAAARINAITFFEILFRTNAGCTLFKSFKDSQPPLEEIARLNGHTELALMLEKKHLMFRDDENDSDDEVDWKAISEKIGEYQAEHDDPVEKWSLQSRDSFKSVHGYLADRENSSSLSSLQVSVGETNHEGVLEEEQAPQVLQEPVLFPFDDKVGRTTFSSNGVESLGKKLTSCSTKDIGDDEAYCSFLRVEDLDGYPKTTKIVTGRKSFLEINERKELQRLPDHHNFNNSRCHVDVVCSLENSHIADNPLCYEEKDSLEIDERLPCVYVNDSSTEPSPTSNSSPLNNGGGKSKFFRMCCKVTLILSMFTIVAIGLAIGSKYLTTADSAKPEGTYQGATPGNMRGHKTSFPPTPQNPCKKTQHWVENAEGPPQCIDCQACPPGQTISPECGNSKPLTPDTTVFCVPCQLGKSFSSEYSTSVCIPCSSCSKDQVVIKNCTRQADIECGKKCYSKDRYYDESKRDCLKCSKCCNDDRDMVESECIGKLGSQSSMICSVHSCFQRFIIESTPEFASHCTTGIIISSAPTTSIHIVTVAFIYPTLCIIFGRQWHWITFLLWAY